MQFIFIFLPIIAILFWLRKKIGWICMVFYISYLLIGTFTYFSFIWPFGFALFGGTLWILCKKDLRAIYKIEKKTMYLSIITGGALNIPLLLQLFS